MKMLLNEFLELNLSDLIAINGGASGSYSGSGSTKPDHYSAETGWESGWGPSGYTGSTKPDHYSAETGWEPGWGPEGYTGTPTAGTCSGSTNSDPVPSSPTPTPIDPLPDPKTQSTFPMCDVYAWNLALEKGFDPRGTDGVNWSNNLTVREIFNSHYALDVTSMTAGAKGFVFYDWAGNGLNGKEHMEYCEVSSDGSSYTNWQTDGEITPTPTPYPMSDKNGHAAGNGTQSGQGTMVFIRLN